MREDRLITLALLGALSAAACKTDTPNRSYAEYDAPASGIRILALAEGTIRRDWPAATYSVGASRTVVVLCPLSSHRTALRLVLSPTRPDRFAVTARVELAGTSFTLDWDAIGPKNALRKVAERAEYSMTADELDEASRVIAGLTAGAKAIYQPGQTKLLRVRRVVSYDATEAAPSLASCPAAL